MKIHLVRHGRAVPRGQWTGDDLLRPLSPRGLAEAEALAMHLAGERPARIVSAPALRCQQTLEPLAVEADLPVEVDERLAEGEETSRLLELFPAAADGTLVLCTHARPLAALLEALELAEPERGEGIPCKKGSLWVLDGPGSMPTRAAYFEPVRSARRRRPVHYVPRAVARPRSVRAAVLDMGSTSFTLLIADVKPRGEIRPVVREKVMLRLGALIASNAHIPGEVCERAVAVAAQLHAVARQEKAQLFLAVATAAVREAHNGRALAAAISEALDEPVRILSGEEEARLMFRAFQQRLHLGREPVLGLDLGGGSLELAVGSASGVQAEATLPLGAVRLHGELVERDPMSAKEAEAVRARVRERLAPEGRGLGEFASGRAVAAGGTVRALGRLLVERSQGGRPRRDGVVDLPLETLRELGEELVHSSHARRLRMRGVRRDRADLLPTGALILETLADELGLEGFTVCDWGLRQGVLLDAFGRAESN